MHKRIAAIAVTTAVAALAISACGGGSSSSPVPAKPATLGAGPGSPLPASQRTRVGTASITFVLPTNAVTGTRTASIAKTQSSRTSQYINPSPGPTFSTYPGNVIDIFVDGTKLINIDGSDTIDSNHSLILVNPATDGTQTATIPLYSTTNNSIVVVEYDANANDILAMGDTEQGPITKGSTNNVSVAMQMNATLIGVIDFTDGSAPRSFYTSGTYQLQGTCSPGGTVQIGLFGADPNGTFIPTAGYGGTLPVSPVPSPGPGTTSFGQSSIAGIYSLVWDSACNNRTVTVSAPNPANALYYDVEISSANDYADGYSNGTINGPNQGLYNLVTKELLNISDAQNPFVKLNITFHI